MVDLNKFEKALEVCENDVGSVDSLQINLHRYDSYGTYYTNEDTELELHSMKENAEKLFQLGSEVAKEGEGIINSHILQSFREDLEQYWRLADNKYFFPRKHRFNDIKSAYIKIKPFIMDKISKKKLKIDIGEEVSPLAKEYLNEAILCLEAQSHRACVVMLGVASEKTLIDLYKSEFNKTDKDIENKKIFQIIEELKNAKKLKDSEKVLADIIRITRNEYGHPKRIDVNPEQVKSFVLSIPRYINEIYKRISSI